MRTAQVTLSQVVSGPLRASCSTSFYLIAGAGVLLAVVAAWLVAERFFRNDLRVCLPLLVTEIPLARHRGGLANCGSIPRPGSLAFSLLLPAGWRQRLFYSGAVLSIHSPDNMLTWSGDQGHELRLPAKRGDAIIREAFAFWQSVPGEASEVQIRLEYGWRSGAVTLQFASGKT
jgi:hypothetical protein